MFWHPYKNMVKKKFLGHISTFFKLQSTIRKKRLKVLKHAFYKSALELIFTPIYPWSPIIFFRKHHNHCNLTYISERRQQKFKKSSWEFSIYLSLWKNPGRSGSCKRFTVFAVEKGAGLWHPLSLSGFLDTALSY